MKKFPKTSSVLAGLIIFTIIFPSSLVYAAENVNTGETIKTSENEGVAGLSAGLPISEVEPPKTDKGTGTTDSSGTKNNVDVSNIVPVDEEPLGGFVEDPEVVDHQRISFNTNKFAQVNESSGTLDFEVSINVPPGRNGMKPSISLQYSSRPENEGSIVGYGWALSIPYIQRLNKRGVDNMYEDQYFTSSISGELASSTTDSTLFSAKTENGDFTKYRFSNNTWVATDKNGTVYTYGLNNSFRQTDPNDEARVYKWTLSEIRDTNDNFIRFEYYKDSGQIYPDKIFYSGYANTDGVFEIDFNRVGNLDYATSTAPGFLVETKSRVSEIVAKINGSWVKKYVLSYSTPTNRVRALLSTVTETGKDESGTEVSIDPYVFTYQDSDTPGWAEDTGWTLPEPIIELNNYPKSAGTFFIELNGDGLPDIIRSRESTSQNPNDISRAYINTGSGWSFSQSWTNALNIVAPSGDRFITNTDTDMGYRIVDVNADGRDDILRNKINVSPTKAYINNGAGWTDDSAWYSPLPFTKSDGKDNGVRIVDLNGDGLPDISRGNNADSSTNYINDTHGWRQSTSWIAPAYYIDSSSYDNGFIQLDINGDGMVDWIRGIGDGIYQTKHTYLNDGEGNWLDTNLLPGLGSTEVFIQNRKDLGYRTADVNGDGKTDIMRFLREQGSGDYKAGYINSGVKWIDLGSDWDNPLPFMDKAPWGDAGYRLVDYDGDGMIDVIGLDSFQTDTLAYKNQSKKVDLLIHMTYPVGGSTSVEYKTAQQYKDSSGNMLNSVPFSLFTVSKITNDDIINTPADSTYEYQDGYFYASSTIDRKFAGFGLVTKTNPDGSKIKTYFHQASSTLSSLGEYDDHISKVGKAFRIETLDSSGNVFEVKINTWDKQSLGNGSYFVWLANTLDMSYDGDSDHKDRAESYIYDAHGNLVQKVEWGGVTGNSNGTFTDIGSDKLTSSLTFVASSTINMYLPSQVLVQNQASTTINNSKYYYDNLSYNSVAKGNLTKEEKLIAGSTYIDTEKTYNSYGLVTQEKDGRDKATNYTYDSYNLYPATTTNALSKSTFVQYDYSSGKPKLIKDQNGYVFQTIYDGLDRAKEEKQPDFASPTSQVTKAIYQYNDSSFPNLIQKTSYLNSGTSTDSYTYTDGFGRVVQQKVEAEDSNKYSTTDTKYNSVGKVLKQSLPYFSTGASSTAATATSSLYVTYEYDPLGRVTLIENSLGETTNVYDDWKLTITDPNGEVKNLYKDAYDNLVKVDEINSGSTYTTNYEYDGNKNLTKITDALGYIRNFTYDNLGRRLTAEDLHVTGDSSFGTWTYAYDDVGNLASSTDPMSHNVVYAYDDINRPLTENYTGQSGTEVTYTYDSCTGGVGLMCTASSSGAYVSNQYFPTGLPKTEIKTIAGNNYTTQYTYDRLGNPVTITHPDDFVTVYGYNPAGQLEKISYKEDANSSLNPLVEDFDYGPTGKVTYQDNYNDTETTNIYDASKLYRMTQKQTIGPSGVGIVELQDLYYIYDAVGNITQLSEHASTTAYRTVAYQYDDLHRLTRASSTKAASNYLETYTYNSIGDITNKSDLGNYTYSGYIGTNYANPHAATAINGATLAYDKNGNLLTYGSSTNVWDYKNQLLQSGITGTGTTTSDYDHTGDRTTYTDNSGTTVYVNKFFDSEGDARTKHIYAGNQLVVSIESKPSEGNIGTGEEGMGGSSQVESCCVVGIPYEHNVHYIHGDHLSGTNVVTDSLGAQSEVTDYLPFGKVRVDTKAGTYEQSQKFTNHEFDSQTGLNYMNARFENGGTGTFLSQDPVFWEVGKTEDGKNVLMNPQLQNSYSYAGNNPITNKDPQGRIIDTIADVGFIGYDLYSIGRNLARGESIKGDITALGLDVAGFALPGITGLGMISRLDDVGKAARGITRAVNATDDITRFGVEYARNQGFKMSERAWSAGDIGDRLGSLVDHFVNHGSEVGAKSVGEYYNKANQFIDSGKGFKMEAKNGFEFWDSKTKTLGITDKSGDVIRSFYKVTSQSKINSLNSKAQRLLK